MSHDLPVLRELVILAGFSLAITLVFQRLRLPAVTGFILTGVLIGPGVLGLVRDLETVQTLAEIGIVLLLFTVGLEFSLADLRELGRRSFAAGALQVALTALLVLALLLAAGVHPGRALFYGLLVSLSSTALLLKLLTDRAELGSPHGRLTFGVLLLQDLAIVPLTVITPVLGDWARGAAGGILFELGTVMRAVATVAIAGAVFLALRRLAPWLLARASRAGSREAFLAAVGLVALGSAYLSHLAGLSLALGAFLAGLVLAGSELRAQVIADILPFRDSLSSIFFISVGMLLVPAEALRNPGLVVAATITMMVLKALAACAAGRIAGFPWSIAIAAGLPLAHVGEFSFVLAQTGTSEGLLSPPWDQVFLVAAIVSLIVTPWLVARSPGWALRADMALRARRGVDATDLPPGVLEAPSAHPQPSASGPASSILAHHVVIAGYGLNGANLARVLRSVRVPHIVVDVSPDKVAECTSHGSQALLGSVVQPEILRRAGGARARVLVLAVSDPFATRNACQLARALNEDLFLIVRTRYVKEVDGFYAAGANLVIPEEFETSIEIFMAVLRQYHVPNHIIDSQVNLLRRERYSLLRGRKLPGSVIEQLDVILALGTTETVLVLQHSPAVGQAAGELGLLDRERGARLVAVVRGGHAVTDLDADFRIQVGDTLVLTGTHEEIERAVGRLAPEATEV